MKTTATISRILFFLLAWVHLAAGADVQAAEQADPAAHFFATHPNEIDLEQRDSLILFANREIGLGFEQSATGFSLARMHGIERGQDFLAEGDGRPRDLFRVRMTLDPYFVQKDHRGQTKHGHYVILDQMAGDDAFFIGSQEAKEVSWRREDMGDASVLHLEWKKIDAREDEGVMDVEVTVTLRAGDPLSYWRINVLNRSAYGTGERHYARLARHGIERVQFPNLSIAPVGSAQDNVFVYPLNRGELRQQAFPSDTIRSGEHFYPHNFNMQFQALYNRNTGNGLYLGTRDPAASFMVFDITHRESEILWRPGHFPPNITFAGEDFDLPYDCVIGPYEGDWYDACQVYRQWAVEQPWCRKGPLAARADIPDWYKHAPLYLYTVLGDSAQGTHSAEENIPIAEKHFMEFLQWAGVPLPANFYELSQMPPGLTAFDIPVSIYRRPRPGRWEGFSTENTCAGNYPEIPMLAGLSASFERLRDAGGMVCPYFGLELFDPGPTFNAPYAAEAMPHLVRDLYGATRRWGSEAALQPCVVTSWWRDRCKETCVLMQQRENVAGFYLDVMQGCSLPCYWTPHGHTAAGGDSMSRGMHELVEIIADAVKAEDPEAITTGENPSENMIDVTDGFLQVTLHPDNTAPIFATVYQDYILRYGLEVSGSERFYVECASMFAEGMQVGRLRLRPRSGTLSFQDPAHREKLMFLKQMVDYYKQASAREFLVYGRLLRPLSFSAPSPMPMSSDRGAFPLVTSGVFRGESGDLGVFVVNASGEDVSFRAALGAGHYGMAEGALAAVHQIASDGTSETVQERASGTLTLAGVLPARHSTLFRIEVRRSGL